MDRSFNGDEATLRILGTGFLALLNLVETLDNCTLLVDDDAGNDAGLSLVLAGENADGVALLAVSLTHIMEVGSVFA